MPGLQQNQTISIMSTQYAKSIPNDMNSNFRIAWQTICNCLKGKWGIGSYEASSGIIGKWYMRGPVYDFKIDVSSGGTYTFKIPFKNSEPFIVNAYSKTNGLHIFKYIEANQETFTINTSTLGSSLIIANSVE